MLAVQTDTSLRRYIDSKAVLPMVAKSRRFVITSASKEELVRLYVAIIGLINGYDLDDIEIAIVTNILLYLTGQVMHNGRKFAIAKLDSRGLMFLRAKLNVDRRMLSLVLRSLMHKRVLRKLKTGIYAVAKAFPVNGIEDERWLLTRSLVVTLTFENTNDPVLVPNFNFDKEAST